LGLLFASVFSTLLHLAFWGLKLTHKLWRKSQYSNYKKFKLQWSNVMDKERLFNYVSHTLAIILFAVGLVHIPRYLNSLRPDEVSVYPNNLLLYFYDVVYPPLGIAVVLGIVMQKNAPLRSEVWNFLKNDFVW
jgi:hypothetical protein